MKSRIALASAAIAAGAAIASMAPATAASAAAPAPRQVATVLNHFRCSPFTRLCRQTNGPFVPGIGTSCSWSFWAYGGTVPSYRVC
jgi:hypothetical protein